MEGKVFVGDKRVTEATVTCRLVPRTFESESPQHEDDTSRAES
jgi:hypothetical protein